MRTTTQAATDLVDPIYGEEDEESPERLRPNRVAGGRGRIQVEELKAAALLGPVGKRKQSLISPKDIKTIEQSPLEHLPQPPDGGGGGGDGGDDGGEHQNALEDVCGKNGLHSAQGGVERADLDFFT